MDKLNKVVKSESVSSYLSCYSTDDDKNCRRERTKIFTNTKSRLMMHYNDNDSSTFQRNVRKLKLAKSFEQSPESSTTTIRALHQRQILERHQLIKERFSEKSPSTKHAKQTRDNEPFDASRLRILSNREITTSIRKTSTRIERRSITQRPVLWQNRGQNSQSKNGRPFQGLNKVNVPTREYHTEIFEKSSHSEIASCSNVNRKFGVPGRSFTYRNNEDQSIDPPSTIMKIEKCETTKELLRKWHSVDLLNKLSQEYQTSPNKRTHLAKSQNEKVNDYNAANIDFQLIKQCLENSSSAIEKFDLLQSLVLTLSNQNHVERQATVQAIVDNDLFGLKRECETSNVLNDLLWPVNVRTPHPLQVSAAKLLNDIVSYQIGRDYFNNVSMVELLTWNSTEMMYDSMADNLIDAMKKLSLNKCQLDDMLEKGLLQWLVNHMKEVESARRSASTSHQECMTDLLRMLLNAENSIECSFVNVPLLVVVLVRYLNVENEYVQVNVCHALRVLFQDETAIEIGNKFNLRRIIQSHIEKTSGSNSKLVADLHFIHDSLKKYRMDSATEIGLGRDDFSSQSSIVGKLVPENEFCQHQVLNMDNESNREIVCETNLGQQSNNMTEREIISNQIAESSSDRNDQIENTKSVKIHQSLPADLKSYILQLCLEDESSQNGAGAERMKQSENPATEILFSNLNSTLHQSSSLLSSGSLIDECRRDAVESLEEQSNKTNLTVDMDNTPNDVATDLTSKLQSKKTDENTSDYLDLSSIAKDPKSRNEILENDSFIDELCEKVFTKLRTKLAQQDFCGANCNTDCKTNCAGDDGAKIEAKV